MEDRVQYEMAREQWRPNPSVFVAMRSPLSHNVAAGARKANPVCCVPHSAVLDG